MCGIFGVCHWQGIGLKEAELALNTIQHRGPDAYGLSELANGAVIFGHRRLSILDLSPLGAQPMRSASGRYSITFNGEIYNFKPLKVELEKANFTFKGGSDTEIMLAAFEAWGIEQALKRFEGMFAFGLWDQKEETLTLARDRLGEKPLYYGWSQAGGFSFSSELRPIRQLLGPDATITRDAVKLLMTWGYIPAPHAILKGFHKLLPGSFLQLKKEQLERRPSSFDPWPETGTLSPQLYWDAQRCFSTPTNESLPYEASVQALDDLLTSVISDEMMSDVPLGAFLSGGIDSSTIVALMQKVSSRPVKTFSIGFHESAFNEAHHAKVVAEHLKTDHTELYISDSHARDIVPKLPQIFDEPFADSSQIPTHLVSQLARQHVTVSLSGDGGDELFGGYPRISWANAAWPRMSSLPSTLRRGIGAQLVKVPEAYSEAVLKPITSLLPRRFKINKLGSKLRRLGELLGVTSEEQLYRRLLMIWNGDDRIVPGTNLQPSRIDTLISAKQTGSYLQWMMLADVAQYLPDDILVKVDRAAMAVSLESRAPLLHHRVVEFAAGLPLNYKVSPSVSKRILRDVLYKYVPQKLIDRPKMGFAIPLGSWLKSGLHDWTEHLLSPTRISAQGIFDEILVTQRWQQHQKGEKDNSSALWCVLMFQAWLDEYQLSV